jgi:hypothetical protein
LCSSDYSVVDRFEVHPVFFAIDMFGFLGQNPTCEAKERDFFWIFPRGRGAQQPPAISVLHLLALDLLNEIFQAISEDYHGVTSGNDSMFLSALIADHVLIWHCRNTSAEWRGALLNYVQGGQDAR